MSISLLTVAAATALRESEDGLTLQELGAAIGTRWPERVVRAMQRDGYVLGEEHGRLHLVVDVERTSGNPPPSTGQVTGVISQGGRDAGLITRASAAGSLSADVDDGRREGQATLSPGLIERPAAVVSAGTLFPVEHEPRSPYDPMSEAA